MHGATHWLVCMRRVCASPAQMAVLAPAPAGAFCSVRPVDARTRREPDHGMHPPARCLLTQHSGMHASRMIMRGLTLSVWRRKIYGHGCARTSCAQLLLPLLSSWLDCAVYPGYMQSTLLSCLSTQSKRWKCLFVRPAIVRRSSSLRCIVGATYFFLVCYPRYKCSNTDIVVLR